MAGQVRQMRQYKQSLAESDSVKKRILFDTKMVVLALERKAGQKVRNRGFGTLI